MAATDIADSSKLEANHEAWPITAGIAGTEVMSDYPPVATVDTSLIARGERLAWAVGAEVIGLSLLVVGSANRVGQEAVRRVLTVGRSSDY